MVTCLLAFVEALFVCLIYVAAILSYLTVLTQLEAVTEAAFLEPCLTTYLEERLPRAFPCPLYPARFRNPHLAVSQARDDPF